LAAVLLSLFWVTMGSAVTLAEHGDFGSCALAAKSAPDDVLYYYTDTAGAKGIAESGVIRPDAKGRVYLTTDKVAPADASNALFMGRGGSMGTHRVDVKMKDTSGQNLSGGT